MVMIVLEHWAHAIWGWISCALCTFTIGYIIYECEIKEIYKQNFDKINVCIRIRLENTFHTS